MNEDCLIASGIRVVIPMLLPLLGDGLSLHYYPEVS